VTQVLWAEGLPWALRAFWGEYQTRVADGLLFRELTSTTTPSSIFPVFPLNVRDLDRLVDVLSGAYPAGTKLRWVPSSLAMQSRHRARFRDEGEAESDYLISIERFSALENFSKKARQRIRRNLQYVANGIFVGDMTELPATARSELASWLSQRPLSLEKDDNTQPQTEVRFLMSVLTTPPLALKCAVLRSHAGVLGLAVFEVPDSGRCAVGISFKVDRAIPGLGRTLRFIQCAYLRSLGIQTLNIMNDCGHPGIRAHKRNLDPIALIPKMSLIL